MNAKLIMMIGLVVMAVFLAGCASRNVACSMEAKVCPDGSAVGRSGPNCEFAPCPEGQVNTSGDQQVGGNTQIANPASVYCQDQGGTMKINETPAGQQGLCVLKDGTVCDEWAYYRRECGRKCSGTCPVFSPVPPGWCADGTIVSGGVDECGCNLAPKCVPGSERTICTAAQKQQVACTMEYAPVCGNDGVTYGNKCSACAAGIDSWVSGECAK